jgi:hypothetical protein
MGRTPREILETATTIAVVGASRDPEKAAAVAREAVAIGAGALWLQQDIVSEEARRVAGEAGVDYVEDFCIAVARALNQIRRAA